jgi:hypothetical protein
MVSTLTFLGFPPSDDSVRDFFITRDEAENIYLLSLCFFIALFEKTTRVLTEDLKMAKSRAARIASFRHFMTDGQTVEGGAGVKRRKFYKEIVEAAENVSHIYWLNFIFLYSTENEERN